MKWWNLCEKWIKERNGYSAIFRSATLTIFLRFFSVYQFKFLILFLILSRFFFFLFVPIFFGQFFVVSLFFLFPICWFFFSFCESVYRISTVQYKMPFAYEVKSFQRVFFCILSTLSLSPLLLSFTVAVFFVAVVVIVIVLLLGMEYWIDALIPSVNMPYKTHTKSTNERIHIGNDSINKKHCFSLEWLTVEQNSLHHFDCGRTTCVL